MWSLDDFESLNPAESGQAVSFLHHLLSISAASEHSLSRAAAHLDALDGPYVMAFAQLPYWLGVPDRAFTVNGWREGVVVDLAFERVAGAFAHEDRFGSPTPAAPARPSCRTG